MANIKVTLDVPLIDGHPLTFKAPCDCTAITGLIVYYPDGESTASKVFTFKDAHKNELTGLGNLFAAGSYVKVVVDTTNNAAYIQNADTNAYLEGELEKKVNKAGDTMTGPLWLSSGYGRVNSGESVTSIFHYPTVGDTSVYKSLAISSNNGDGRDAMLHDVNKKTGKDIWHDILHTGNSNMTRLVATETTPTVNGQINWTYE